jgi:hypothetical protein
VASETSLYVRVERRLPDLLTELADVPAARRAGSIAEDSLRALLHGLREKRLSTDDELAALRTSAVRRAEERVPLASLLAACHAAVRVCWRALVAESGSKDGATALAVSEHLLSHLEQLTGCISDAYLEEQGAIQREAHDARHALATALLAGDPVDEAASRLGVVVAAAYVPLALHLHAGDGRDRGAVGAVAGRRRLRGVQEQLDAFAGEPVLGVLDPTGGTVLLPTVPDQANDLIDRLPRLVIGIQTVIGGEVIAGAAGCAAFDDVARAARQARDVLGLARRLGRPPGVYVLSDVLLEYQLTRDSDALPMLAGLLDPLDANVDLVRTLETYFAHDLDRRTTAGLLHVHPNTLDYRLRRIAQLTGLDPARPSGQQLLAAALTARRRGGGAPG